MDNDQFSENDDFFSRKKVIWLIILAVFLVLAVFIFVPNRKDSLPELVKETDIENEDVLEKTIVDTFVERLSFEPNFNEVSEVIEDGVITWVLTNGGVAKIDNTGDTVKFYTPRDGLTGFYFRSMVKHGDGIWISSNYGISRIDIETEKVKNYYATGFDPTTDSWEDTFGQFSYTKRQGLASNANLKLAQDPYTGELWASSFEGVSRYMDELDEWVSYGQAESYFFSATTKMFFTENGVGARLTSNAYSSGGLVYFDKKQEEWKYITHEEGFILQERDSQYVRVTQKDVFTEARPVGYSSCGEKDTVKASGIQHYRLGEGWDALVELNEEIKLNEGVIRMEAQNGILQVWLRPGCGSKVKGPTKLLEYNIESRLVNVFELDGTLLVNDEQERFKTILSALEKATGRSALSRFLYVGPEGIVMSRLSGSTPNTIQSYWKANEDLNASEIYPGLRSRLDPFLDLNNLSSNKSFDILECNGFNGSMNEIYVSLYEQPGMFGPSSNALMKYDSATDVLELVRKIDYSDEADREVMGILEPIFCSQNLYIVFDEVLGVSRFDFESEEYMPFDANNFAGTSSEYWLIGEKVYFMSGGGKLGVFDLNELIYSYISLGLSSDLPFGVNHLATLQLEDVEGEKYVFISRNKDLQQSIFIFDAREGNWETRRVAQELYGRVGRASFVDDLMVVATHEGIFDGLLYVGLVEGGEFERVSIAGAELVIGDSAKHGTKGYFYEHEDNFFIDEARGVWTILPQ